MRVLRGFVEYRDEKRVMTIPVGLELGSAVVHISKGSILKWKAPYDKEVLTEAKKEEILDNVCEALRFAKCIVELN